MLPSSRAQGPLDGAPHASLPWPLAFIAACLALPSHPACHCLLLTSCCSCALQSLEEGLRLRSSGNHALMSTGEGLAARDMWAAAEGSARGAPPAHAFQDRGQVVRKEREKERERGRERERTPVSAKLGMDEGMEASSDEDLEHGSEAAAAPPFEALQRELAHHPKPSRGGTARGKERVPLAGGGGGSTCSSGRSVGGTSAGRGHVLEISASLVGRADVRGAAGAAHTATASHLAAIRSALPPSQPSTPSLAMRRDSAVHAAGVFVRASSPARHKCRLHALPLPA